MPDNLVFVSDVHLDNYKRWGGDYKNGVNRRCRELLDVLSHATDLGENVFVLGDLFDRFSVDAPVIAAAGDVLSQKLAYILKGNHDANSEDKDDNALAPLKRFANIEVDDGEAVVRMFHMNDGPVQVISIPFQPREAIEYIPEQLESIKDKLADEYTILCFHAGIISGDTPSYLVNSPDAINALTLAQIVHSYGINACVAGHWHDTKTLWYYPDEDKLSMANSAYVPVSSRTDRNSKWPHVGIFQPGTLAPHSFKPGDTGNMLGRIVVCEGPNQIGLHPLEGPRFYKDSWKAKQYTPSDAFMADGPTYFHFTCKLDEFEEAKKRLKDLKDKYTNIHGVVTIEDSALKASVREAAKAASQATDLKEAVSTYVGKLKLPKAEEKRIMSKLGRYLDL